MIKILADQNLYHLNKFLPEECEVILYNPQEPIPLNTNPDAWLLNTVTKVNPTSFPDFPDSLKFIGSGSSGSDHLHIPYLKKNGIQVEDAKGCNARAVAEYVLTSLILLKEKKGLDFQTLNIGIIGVGAVGTLVDELLTGFGCTTVLYDPPRAEREPDFKTAGVDDILQCDILTFHTPLIFDGNHPTFHWLDEEKLSIRNYSVIINTSRGGVIDEAALISAYKHGQIEHLITDVWEKEPDFNPELADVSFIATPHIAGYSEQAKLNASRIISEKCGLFSGLEPKSDGKKYDSIPAPLKNEINSLSDLLITMNPILKYDQSLRNIQLDTKKIKLFPGLRIALDYRYEYRFLEFEDSILSKFPELQLLRS